MTLHIPTTREDAEARFSCSPLRARMGGHACAARWRRAEDTARENVPATMGARGLTHCHNCPAGEARARLIPVDAERPKLTEEEMAELTPTPTPCKRCGRDATRRRGSQKIDPRMLAYCVACTNSSQCQARRAGRPSSDIAWRIDWLDSHPYAPAKGRRKAKAKKANPKPAAPKAPPAAPEPPPIDLAAAPAHHGSVGKSLESALRPTTTKAVAGLVAAALDRLQVVREIEQEIDELEKALSHKRGLLQGAVDEARRRVASLPSVVQGWGVAA